MAHIGSDSRLWVRPLLREERPYIGNAGTSESGPNSDMGSNNDVHRCLLPVYPL